MVPLTAPTHAPLGRKILWLGITLIDPTHQLWSISDSPTLLFSKSRMGRRRCVVTEASDICTTLASMRQPCSEPLFHAFSPPLQAREILCRTWSYSRCVIVAAYHCNFSLPSSLRVWFCSFRFLVHLARVVQMKLVMSK